MVSQISGKMLMKLLKNTKLQSEVKKLYQKNKENIVDIILFGSSVKGKLQPNDIDICIIYLNKDDLDLNYELKTSLKKILNKDIEVTSIIYQKIFEPVFKIRESLFLEGISLISKKKISESWGFKPYLMVRYELKGKNKSERMRFYYSLYGRGKDSKGMISELCLIKFSGSTVLCPIENSEEIKEFFSHWGIEITAIPILLPFRYTESALLRG